MRLLVTGSQLPSFVTIQRLILVSDEIGFLDRPSGTFPDWGTIGRASDIRQFKIDNSPITFSVHEPPSGPAGELYLPFITADMRNARFREAVYDGLRDETFAWRFIQPKAKHGRDSKLGTELRDDLLGDAALPQQDVTEDPVGPMFTGQFGTTAHRRALFKTIVIEASIQITSALVMSDQTGLAPVSDDSHLMRLLAMRTADEHYVGQRPHAAGPLGIAVMSALIPDEALRSLTINDVFEYRHNTKDAYAAWMTEIDRLTLRLTDIDPATVQRELPAIIHGEFRPRMLEYRNELKSARDRMFGDLIKRVTTWELPSLSLAYLAGLSMPGAIAAFAAALAPSVPAVVDYFTQRRELNRTNAAAYLVGLMPDDGEGR